MSVHGSIALAGALALAVIGCAGSRNGGASIAPTPLPGSKALCPAGYQSQLAAGQHSGFASGGQSRSFHLLLPSDTFTGPRPLLMAFHGTGLSGAQGISDYGLADWVAAGFIVVAPDSAGNGTIWPVWDAARLPTQQSLPNADLTLVDDLLQCVAAHHAVDAKRLYVAGHSAGGAMTNYVLGHRSSTYAGGIPASGAFDLTQAVPAASIDPLMVIVTWGGDNDVYSGSTGGVSVDSIGYQEQSALASQFWEAQPGSHQIHCKGAEVGHQWLGAIGGWMRDELLAHPKGAAQGAGPALPSSSQATCSEAAATYSSGITVACSTSAVSGCQAYCQLLGDCLVENGTLGPVAADPLAALGFSSSACTSCLSTCATDAQGSAPDAAALSCIADGAPATACGPGFAGTAVFTTLGTCCGAPGASGSHACARFCAAFGASSIFQSVLSGCP